MSQIEHSGKQILEPMLMGEMTVLDPVAQRAVASWIALRIAVAWKAHPQRWEFPERWLEWLYEHRTAPRGWRVWIGAFVSPRALTAYSTAAVYRRSAEVDLSLGNGDLQAIEGLISTMLAGRVIIKVAGFDRHQSFVPRADYLVPVAPSPGVNITWPPRSGFTDAEIDALFDWPLTDGSSRMGMKLSGL